MNGSSKRPNTLLRPSRKALLSCALLCAVLCTGCAAWQRQMIYFPPVTDPVAAEREGRRQGLELWTNASCQPIGWKRLSPVQPARGQVLVLHGNAGCAFQCGHYADVIQQAETLDVYMVEYPGYGGRPGKPSERALDQAAEDALEILQGKSGPVYLLGESLGTGVACYLAGKYPGEVAGVVLLAPFNRLADVGQAHAKIIPVRWILCDRFASEEYLYSYRGPVAMLVGGRDKVVPAKFGQCLYKRYAGPKRLWQFPECDHESVMSQSPARWKQIVEFWQRTACDDHAGRRGSQAPGKRDDLTENDCGN